MASCLSGPIMQSQRLVKNNERDMNIAARKEKAMAENTNSWFREKILLGKSNRDYIISLATLREI